MTKTKFPAELGRQVADELIKALSPHCEPGRVIAAGSLRRGKPEISDVEILYVSRPGRYKEPGELLEKPWPAANVCLMVLLANRVVGKRLNVRGQATWGDEIKLAVHLASGVPVDFFATTEEAWFNYLVCRTGPAELNMAIAKAAQERGWKWAPFGAGFASQQVKYYVQPMRSEREVFEFVGLPYREPEEREVKGPQ